MADSILRLKVESQEYDNKLKQATNGLTRYVDECRKVGGTLEFVEKETLDYVRSLGQMDTTSRTATGKLAEMKKTFVELSAQYKQISDAEKNAPFGKALAASLDQLKPRIIDAKNQLDEINESLRGMPSNVGGGLFSGMGDKMSGAIQVFAGNIMTKAAGAVAELGSEIFASVQQGIELARQGEGIRNAFERLGRGDILNGLREATHGTVTDLELMKAAVKFNDFKLPLDQLGTMLAFAQQKAKDTGQSVDYLVESIVNGLGRKSLMILDNLGLSAAEIKEKMAETGDMTKAVGEIIREQMSNAGDYIETAADRASQAHVSLQNKMEELGRKFLPLKEASDNFWTSMKIGILDVIGGPLTNLLNKLTEAGRLANQYGLLGGNAKVGRLTTNLINAREGNRQSIYQQQQEQFWRYINPREQQIKDIRAWQRGERGEALQGRINAITEKYGSLDATKIQAEVDAAKKMLSDYQQAAKTILQPIKQEIVPTVTPTGRGSGKGGGGSTTTQRDMTEMQSNQQRINELTQEYINISDQSTDAVVARQEEIRKEISLLEARNNTLKLYSEQSQGKLLGGNVQTSGLEGSQFRGFAAASLDVGAGLTPEALEAANAWVKAGNDSTKAWTAAASAVQGVGSALGNIEDPAAKIMSTIAMAIANVAMAYTETLAKDKTSKSNIWLFIATAAAAMTSMISTISSIHSATGYAQGGEIKGNSYSGDNIPIMANAGEIVLNKAQQATLASSIQQNGGGGSRVVGILKGEDIVLMADRWGMRTGRGELLFGKNL